MPDFFFAGVNQPASNFIPPVGADAGAFVPGVLPPTPPPPPSGPAPSAPVTLPPVPPLATGNFASSQDSGAAFDGSGGGDYSSYAYLGGDGILYGLDSATGAYTPINSSGVLPPPTSLSLDLTAPVTSTTVGLDTPMSFASAGGPIFGPQISTPVFYDPNTGMANTGPVGASTPLPPPDAQTGANLVAAGIGVAVGAGQVAMGNPIGAVTMAQAVAGAAPDIASGLAQAAGMTGISPVNVAGQADANTISLGIGTTAGAPLPAGTVVWDINQFGDMGGGA